MSLGKWIMFIARRINSPTGEFLGLVIGLIDTQYLAEFYKTISMIPGEAVTLLRRDGLVIAGYPDIANLRGKRLPAQIRDVGDHQAVSAQQCNCLTWYHADRLVDSARYCVSIRPMTSPRNSPVGLLMRRAMNMIHLPVIRPSAGSLINAFGSLWLRKYWK